MADFIQILLSFAKMLYITKRKEAKAQNSYNSGHYH